MKDYDVAVSRIVFRDMSGRQAAAIQAPGAAIATYDPENPAATSEARMATGAMCWGEPPAIRGYIENPREQGRG